MQFNSSVNPSLNQRNTLQHLVRRAYIIWAGLWWLFGFLILLPFFTVCILVPVTRPAMQVLNTIWCWLFFPMAFLKVRTVGKNNFPKESCIYISNHGSFLDIPLLTFVLPGFPAFMGKSSLGKIPVFGFMFRNLHIVVDRHSTRGRAKAMKDTLEMLKSGRSVVIFPEGGIHHSIQPDLAPFKDGAFSMAIQTGLPVVPITICHNWFILPDDGNWLPRNGLCKTVVHKAIPTQNLSENDLPALKEKCHDIIRKTLIRENEHGNPKYRTGRILEQV